MARLSIEKDHEKLIRAFNVVRNSFPDARLLILGEGYLYFHLKELIQLLNLENHVYLLGYKENPHSYLKSADCFVLSSNHEGQPVVLQEALILSKPIISTDIPASVGVLSNTGALIVENSEAGLIEGMLNFLNHNSSDLRTHFDFSNYNKEAFGSFLKVIS